MLSEWVVFGTGMRKLVRIKIFSLFNKSFTGKNRKQTPQNYPKPSLQPGEELDFQGKNQIFPCFMIHCWTKGPAGPHVWKLRKPKSAVQLSIWVRIELASRLIGQTCSASSSCCVWMSLLLSNRTKPETKVIMEIKPACFQPLSLSGRRWHSFS